MARDPLKGRKHAIRGRELLRRYRYREAAEALAAAVEADPQRLADHLNLAVALIGAGEPRQAITALSAILEPLGIPEDLRAAAFRLRADAWARTGDFESAEADCRAALALRPADSDCLNALAALRCKQGRLKEGLALFVAAARAERQRTAGGAGSARSGAGEGGAAEGGAGSTSSDP